MTFNEAVSCINEISKLDHNWNLYGAPPIPKKAIENAMNLLSLLKVMPEIYPTANESIQFEWKMPSGEYFELEIFDDSIIPFPDNDIL